MHKTRLTVVATVWALAAAGCQPTLGPGQAWWTFTNGQNNFARLQIDGAVTGPTIRPREERRVPLSMSAPHAVVVSRGSYTQVLTGWGDFREEYVVDFSDPPFTLTWNPEGGGWQEAR